METESQKSREDARAGIRGVGGWGPGLDWTGLDWGRCGAKGDCFGRLGGELDGSLSD